MKRVVITGMGAVTPIGNDVQTFWNNIKKGTCGIDYITQFDASESKVKIAAEVKDFSFEGIIDGKDAKRMARFTQLGMVAAHEAWEDSQISGTVASEELGVFVGAGIGGIYNYEIESIKVHNGKANRVSPFLVPSMIPNILAGQIAIKYGAKAMCTCPVVACATGTYAIGDAFIAVREGKIAAAVCGGAESTVSPTVIAGFANMTALSSRNEPLHSSIPFDKERDGFVLGEGAGIMIIEEMERAKARGAHIYAEIVGYGATCDAYHITAPSSDGAGAARAMQNAIDMANISAQEIDYINAHGTSTPANDRVESLAINSVLGTNNKASINSTKSMIGHGLGAAGAVEAIVCVKSLQDNFVHATIGTTDVADECNINVVKEAIDKEITYALSNSLGFGGHNGTLIIKK